MTRPTWNQYFMSIAEVASTRSIDAETQVGSVVTNADHHIIGTGYNSHPRGIENLPVVRPAKYKHMVHAEVNALIHCVVSPKDAILYCTLHPCYNCSMLIINAGIKVVVYKDRYVDSEEATALLQAAGVEVIQL